MKRTASEIINDLEMRVARLEKESRTLDFFKSYKGRANDIVNQINKVAPKFVMLSEPTKSNRSSNQAKAIFEGYDLLGDSNNYKIVFLSDDKYHSPFSKGIGNMFTQSSFTFYVGRKEIATAKNGVMDSSFFSKVKSAFK